MSARSRCRAGTLQQLLAVQRTPSHESTAVPTAHSRVQRNSEASGSKITLQHKDTRRQTVDSNFKKLPSHLHSQSYYYLLFTTFLANMSTPVKGCKYCGATDFYTVSGREKARLCAALDAAEGCHISTLTDSLTLYYCACVRCLAGVTSTMTSLCAVSDRDASL